MVKKILILSFCLLIVIKITAQNNRLLTNKYSYDEVLSSLDTTQNWVPFPEYGEREAWNRLFGDQKEKLISQGKDLLYYKWEVTTFTSYLEFRRSGLREPMEYTFNKNIKNLSQLLLAELAEGEGRFIDQIINGSMMLCEMTSWSLAAHLVVQPNRSPMPNHKYEVIDLVSGDLSSLLAWTNYFFKDTFDKIEPEISERIVYELNKKTISPYMDGEKYWWIGFGKGANGFVNNWNPWCNSNVLATALLTISDKSELAEVVYKTMRSVDEFFNYIKPDGACEEGPSYWQHAAGKAFDYLFLLDLATKGKISLFDNKQIKDMGEYICKSYIGDDWMVNFADAEAKAKLNYYHIFRYGKAVNSLPMMEFASYLNQKQYFDFKVGRDLFDTLSSFLIREEIKSVKPKLNHAKATWYPDTEFVYFTNDKAFFAAKGGYNDESHNHNDVGSFIFYIDNNPVLIDAGVGTYTAKTFSNKRYELWNMQSGNHNLPIINGVEQKNGRRYKSKEVNCNLKHQKFSLDISEAYPETAAVKQWIRSYELKSKELVIDDEFSLEKAQKPHVINFMTCQEFTIEKEGKLSCIVNGKKVELIYNPKQFNVEFNTIDLDDIRFTKFWGTSLYKLSFTSKDLKLSDKYSFKLKY